MPGFTHRPHVAALDMGSAAETNLGRDNEDFFYAQLRYIGLEVVGPLDACTTGDGKKFFRIPADLNGMNLVTCDAYHVTVGAVAGPTLIQIANVTDAVDMLSTLIMIDTGENGSNTAAVAYVVDGTKDDVATFDVIRIDVDQLPTTAPLGLVVTLGFAHP